MLVELGLVEQRYRAVREVLEDGATVTEVARNLGVSRQTLHRWLRVYSDQGLPALANQTTKPNACPHQMPPATEALVVEMRELHPDWGPRRLHWHLAKRLATPPSRSAIYRALVRRELISPEKRPRRRSDYRRWERERPMELWQMDVMGHVQLADGTMLSAVTGIDDHSRYCVIARLVKRATAEPVCEALLHGLKTHGLPEAILTDNGKVFTGRFTVTKPTVRFDRICRENGIRHLLTAPYSPTTTGKIERLHKTMRREFFTKHLFKSIQDAQNALDQWVAEYNHERPHQSIGDVVPGDRFAYTAGPRDEAQTGELSKREELVRPSGIQRWVDSSGRIGVANHSYTVGKHFAGDPVEVLARDGLLEIYHEGVLISTQRQRGTPKNTSADLLQRLPQAVSAPVRRTANRDGQVSFAGTVYRAGRMYRFREIEVTVAGGSVHLAVDGVVVRIHPARHDPRKEYAAFAQPKARGPYRNSTRAKAG